MSVEAPPRRGRFSQAASGARGERPLTEEQQSSQVDQEEPLLLRACRRRDLFQVQALLRDKADPDVRNSAGETPLLEAAAGGNLDVVALLLGFRADPSQRACPGPDQAASVERADREAPPPVKTLFEIFRNAKLETSMQRATLAKLDPGALSQLRTRLRLSAADREAFADGGASPAPCLAGGPVHESCETADHRVAMHMADSLRPVLVVSPLFRSASATVVFLHGIFQTGRMLERMACDLLRSLPHVRFVAPTAPTAACSYGRGPTWLEGNLFEWDGDCQKSLHASCQEVLALLERERTTGIPSGRVVLAGFSQGGVVATNVACHMGDRFAGLLLLGTASIVGDADSDPSLHMSPGPKGLPVLHCHGTSDNLVKVSHARASADCLERLGCEVQFSLYENVGHTVPASMLSEIRPWLAERLPPLDAGVHCEEARQTPTANQLPVSSIPEPLAVAAVNNDLAEVKRLLRQRADPNACGSGCMPLFEAVRARHALVAAVLLLGKADPNISGADEELMSGTASKSSASALVGLAQGAKVDFASQRAAFAALDGVTRFLVADLLKRRCVGPLAVSDVLSEEEWDAVVGMHGG